MRAPVRLTILLLLLAAAHSAQAQAPAARPLLNELQQIGLDPTQSYRVADLRLHRDAVRFRLDRGTLVFLQPVAGRITGAVFEGAGQVLVLPPDRVERQQLAKFTGSPILTETFNFAYFRFSDETAAEWRRQIRGGAGERNEAGRLLQRAQTQVATLNQLHSVRLLMDFIETAAEDTGSKPDAPYFYAAIRGDRLGVFDVVVDDRRTEQVLVGQLRTVDGVNYYDVWCSFTRRDPPRRPAVKATAYRIDATITPERELEALCEVDLELANPRQRVLLFQLSRFLTVEEVADASPQVPAEAVEFFQNATFTAEEARYRGSDLVLVVLPPSARGPQHRLRFRYRGRVISDIGGGVLFVGARDSWYPRPDLDSIAHYELRFRWPRSLELVAPGSQSSVREEADWKESAWVSEVPLAGFNVGAYESREIQRSSIPISVYANRRLEPQLARAAESRSTPLPLPGFGGRRAATNLPSPTIPPAPPALMLEEVADRVGDAMEYFTQLLGPFPYPQLKVSQIPGRFGQGYPGIIYLSTLSFLPAADQARLGLEERVREHFSRLTPAHETAHQWWGNHIRFPDYRDRWLAESLASYSALLYLEHQTGTAAVIRQWLERYRSDLFTRIDGETVESTGALSLGMRVNSSRSPNAYATLVYSKGPWVLHMLREVLRDPQTGSDGFFLAKLRELAARGGELTTEEFQREFEKGLPAYADAEGTGRLDWFFQQWVYDTGIPRYKLEWRARGSQRAGWRVEGSIAQSGVSELFTMPLPVYARFGEELAYLGRVVVTGNKVAFRFRVKAKPDEVLLDPHRTALRHLE